MSLEKHFVFHQTGFVKQFLKTGGLSHSSSMCQYDVSHSDNSYHNDAIHLPLSCAFHLIHNTIATFYLKVVLMNWMD